jgi:hypothetical protein
MVAKIRFLPVATVLLLAACGQAPNAPSESSPAKAETPATGGLSATPDTVRTCDAGKKLTSRLQWDVTGSKAENVTVTVENPKTHQEKRFGHGGPVGTKQTGPWLRPGLVFRVRDSANGRELAAVTIKGVPCP